jgi:hypothetical protein
MIDWNKPIQTLNGSDAKLVATVQHGEFRRVVTCLNFGSADRPVSTLVNDFGLAESGVRLIQNTPEPRRFRNLYRDLAGKLQLGESTFDSVETAIGMAERPYNSALTLLGTYEERL